MALVKLPDSELAVMLALWEADSPIPRSYLDEKLSFRKWNINTMNTLLSRLLDKGFVTCERRGRENIYAPAVSRANYLAFEGKSILGKLYNNSIKDFILSVSDDGLSREDIGSLQQYLEELKGGVEND